MGIGGVGVGAGVALSSSHGVELGRTMVERVEEGKTLVVLWEGWMAVEVDDESMLSVECGAEVGIGLWMEWTSDVEVVTEYSSCLDADADGLTVEEIWSAVLEEGTTE